MEEGFSTRFIQIEPRFTLLNIIHFKDRERNI
jgi:hypothetical protein